MQGAKPSKKGPIGHTDVSHSITDNRTSTSNEDPQTISKIHAKAKDGATKGDALDKPDGSGLVQLLSKSGPSSPLSDTPPSPSSSSHSSSNSMQGHLASNIKDSTVITPNGDLHYHFRPRGYSFRKAKWMSRYRCDKSPPSELRLITWNVDFMAPHSDLRLLRILSYLSTSVLSSPPEPCCILFQELQEASLEALRSHEWVRKHFTLAPDSVDHWSTSYGDITLVSRNVPILDAQKLKFADSGMGRSATFVDIPLRSATGKLQTVRVANTHLESLVRGTSMRPLQLKAIAAMLRADGVDGGVVGGDMNMIGDTADQNIHVAAGLEDACLFPDDPASHTWGYQPPCQYPPRRLDRVFFTGEGLIVDSVEVIGKGLRIKNGQWVSDHCGLATTLSFSTPKK